MNRHATIVVLSASLSFAAAAASAATCEIGVKGGVAIQKLGGDDVNDQFESRTGFVGGAYLLADFSRSIGVRLEALYFMKGASADSADASVTVKLDYVEFPLLAVVHVPLSETARLDLFGGPTFSFKTRAELEASEGAFSASFDIGDIVNSFDFGLTLGGGLSFDVGPAILGIDGRYGFGLKNIGDSDLADDPGADDVEEVDIKNQGFAVMGSIGFPIGQK